MTIDDFRITAFALNEVAQAERPSIQAEVNDLAECRHEVEAISKIGALLSAEFAAEPLPELTRERRLAVESELARLAGVPGLRRQVMRFAALAAILSACFSQPLYQLVFFAIRSQSFSYIPLIPVISFWLIWRRRTKVETETTPAWGFGVVAVTFGVAILAAFGHFDNSGLHSTTQDYLGWMTPAFLLLLLGAGFVCLGTKVLRSISFPLALLIFTVPFPAELRQPMESFREHSVMSIASGLFQMAGIPARENGWLLQVGVNPSFTIDLSVQSESVCFGMRSFLLLLIGSLIVGNILLRGPWKRAVLTLSVVPIDILVNAIQMFVVGELWTRFGTAIVLSPIQRMGGTTFLVLSLIPFILILALLRRSESRNSKLKPLSEP